MDQTGATDVFKTQIELVYVNCVHSLVTKVNVMFKLNISWVVVYTSHPEML